MKITVELELTEQEATYIRQNSIERVINTAHRMAEACEVGKMDAFVKENASVSCEDLEDSKPIATKLWNAVRDAIFVQRR